MSEIEEVKQQLSNKADAAYVDRLASRISDLENKIRNLENDIADVRADNAVLELELGAKLDVRELYNKIEKYEKIRRNFQ